MVVTCRNCKSKKTAGDICPVCQMGMKLDTFKIRKGQPTKAMAQHGHHEVAAGIGRMAATGRCRS